MTVAELSKIAHTSLKVMSAYNGKVLCHRFDPNNHKEIGEREVKSVFADLRILDGVFGKQCTPLLCVYADGAPEAFKEHPF